MRTGSSPDGGDVAGAHRAICASTKLDITTAGGRGRGPDRITRTDDLPLEAMGACRA